MKKYFKKGIDFLCDVCYTVITEGKGLLGRHRVRRDLIPGIPDSTERCLSKQHENPKGCSQDVRRITPMGR